MRRDPSIAQSSLAGAGAAAWPAKELIPRNLLFGNPTRAAAQVSPDGAHIAFLAPRDGVLNIWASTREDPEDARPLTAVTARPILEFWWAPDSARVLYRLDESGTEDFQLYGATLFDAATVSYTPFAKTMVSLVRTSHRVKDAILIGLNSRDARWHDIYRLDLASGRLTEVWRNPGGYSRVIADAELNLVLAQRIMDGGGVGIERFGESGLSPLFRYGREDSLSTTVLTAIDRRHVHLLDSRDRDTAALSVMDAETGAACVVAEDERVDIGGSIKHPLTGALEAYSVNYLTCRWIALDANADMSIAAIDEQASAEWMLISQSEDDRFWTVMVDTVTEPPAFHLFDRHTSVLSWLFSSRPALRGKRLAPMHPREIPARDGLTLVSYLSLPPDSDCDGDGVPDRPLPLVLNVHGGPWGRDVNGFEREHQWLANRGYAVLAVNFRASTGFGKAFVNAGDLEWGRKMQDDLLDAVEWAIAAGVTSRDMVAIMGGSYGGYATLVGLSMTPGVFRCGVEIVGPSNLVTILETVPPYWQALYEEFAHRMGDPRTEDGRALLEARSPVHKADQINAPLLIGQGANDPRVNKRESDQIVAAMKENSIPVTYVLFPDEGHGFRRPENALAFNALAEGFLAASLGGACEPIGQTVSVSSMQVLEGAGLIAGLDSTAS